MRFLGIGIFPNPISDPSYMIPNRSFFFCSVRVLGLEQILSPIPDAGNLKTVSFCLQEIDIVISCLFLQEICYAFLFHTDVFVITTH